MIKVGNRIAHISDQVSHYSYEIVEVVRNIRAQGFTTTEALKIVELGIQSINSDVEHERNGLFHEYIEVINE